MRIEFFFRNDFQNGFSWPFWEKGGDFKNPLDLDVRNKESIGREAGGSRACKKILSVYSLLILIHGNKHQPLKQTDQTKR